MKDIIIKLHQGLSVDEAKERFEKEVGNISSTEIAEIEQTLINEGLSPEEIKKFCNVHALIFQSALEKSASEETFPSHPVYLFKLENREIEKLAGSLKRIAEKKDEDGLPSFKKALKELLLKLQGIKTHYENKGWTTGPHIYIAPDGIWLFTDMRKNGTHAGRKGNNRSIGIEMVGDFQSNAPQGVVWETTMFVITALNKKLNLLTENIKFHRDFTATACPGKATKKEWVIKQLQDYISLPNNALVKGETKQAVYFVKRNIKYPIPDWKTFVFFWESRKSDIKIISDEKLEQTKKGKTLPSIKNLI